MLFRSAFGCGVVLDDFGAGHSDLGRLHRLPLDKVKIDRAFVRETDADPRALQILGAMIEICDRLGLTCIIEGVETEAQLDRLRHLGCDLFQGYLFGAPAQLVAPAPPIADVA